MAVEDETVALLLAPEKEKRPISIYRMCGELWLAVH